MVGTEQNFEYWINEGQLNPISWLPIFYSAQFLQLDQSILENPENFQPASAFIAISKMVCADRVTGIGWVAHRQNGKITFEPRSVRHDERLSELSCMPAEAILIAVDGQGELEIGFWDEKIYGSRCAVYPSISVFESADENSVAWLVEELESTHCQLQIKRRISGTLVPRLAGTEVLGIYIKKSRREDRAMSAALCRRKAELDLEQQRMESLMRSRQLMTGAILSGGTFEERRNFFEELLTSKGLPVEPLAFIEASTTDTKSDLFLVRSLSERPQDGSDVQLAVPSSDKDAEDWRKWYWDESASDFRLFHVFGRSESPILPASVMRRLASLLAGDVVKQIWPPLEADARSDRSRIVGFKQFAEICRGTLLREGIEGLIESREVLMSLTKNVEPPTEGDNSRADNTLAFYRKLYRPVLAVRVRRDGKPVGAYLVTTKGTLEEIDQEEAMLESLGTELSATLSPPPELLQESSRRESLRRLSWLMHQLNGPLGRAASALDHIDEFISHRQDVARCLIPSEEEAKRMAMMNEAPVSDYSLANRIDAVKRAFGDIKKVTYQIRRLRRAQSVGEKVEVNLANLLKNCAIRSREELPGLQVIEELDPAAVVFADQQMLAEAIEEVVSNCLRELRMQRALEPRLTLRTKLNETVAELLISDNALPESQSLIEHPFEEDASTYSPLNKGTGLGLTIVRETFRTHGGTCSLEKNRDPDGAPAPGVSFVAKIPVSENT